MKAISTVPPQFIFLSNSTLVVLDEPRKCPTCGHAHRILLNVNGRTICYCCQDERKHPLPSPGLPPPKPTPGPITTPPTPDNPPRKPGNGGA